MSAPTRALLIATSTFPRWEDDTQSDFVFQQALWLKRQDPSLLIEILCPDHSGALISEEIEGIQVTRFPYFFPRTLQKLAYPAIKPNLKKNFLLWLQVPFLFFFLFCSLLRRATSYPKIPILYAHWAVPQGFVVSLLGKLLNARTILTSHSSDIPTVLEIPIIGKFLAKRMLNSFDEITCVNSKLIQLVQELAPERSSRPHNIPMGFSPSLLTIDLSKKNLESNRILFIGRLSEKKGLIPFLHALHSLSEPFTLEIVGSGEQKDELVTLIQELELDNRVVMHGHLTGEKKQALFASSVFLAVPSIETSDNDTEGLPVSLLEGMAAGLICFASFQSNAQEVVTHRQNGLLFDSCAPQGLKEGLSQALRLGELERTSLAMEARQQASLYSWNVLAERYRSIIFPEVNTRNEPQ